jgi:hypothetical protein
LCFRVEPGAKRHVRVDRRRRRAGSRDALRQQADVRRLALGSRAQVTTVVFGAFGVDDGAMGEQAVRKASRGALAAQRRAIEVEQRAAWVYERAGNVDGSARERATAAREQQRLAAAEHLHPEWV